MNKITSLLFTLMFFTISNSFAQQLNFQGVARSSSGAALVSQNIKVRLTVRDASPTGAIQYSETRSALTSAYGSFKIAMGSIGATNVTGTINTVTWAASPKFLQVEVDPANGTSFTDMGTTEMVTARTSPAPSFHQEPDTAGLLSMFHSIRERGRRWRCRTASSNR